MAGGTRHALVVGAGIIGISCALALRRRGFAVTVVDERGPGEATSFGNAGCIAVAEISPVSMPGLAWRVPRMLLDPLGPLSIRWTYLPRLAPWLWRFMRAGAHERVGPITQALAGLAKHAWSDFQPVIDDAGLGASVTRNGMLYVYESEAAFAKAAPEWELRARHGVRIERVDANKIRELEPALAPHFQHGYLSLDTGHVADPHKIVTGLAEHLRRQGGAIASGRVVGFTYVDEKPRAARLDGGTKLDFDDVVICTGAWSRGLCRQLGHDVPLDTERGYNTTLPDPGVRLSRPVCPAEGNFVITPMAMGLRIGGAVELAGLDAPPNYARARALLALGKRALPTLNATGGREWIGFRPSMPDSLPVIGRSPEHANVFFAFGHGHLGLTFSATTGRLIGELVAGAPPSLDLTPFRIDRF